MNGPSRHVCGRQLVDGVEQPPELGPGFRSDFDAAASSDPTPRWPRSPARCVDPLDRHLPGVDDRPGGFEQVAPIEAGHPADRQDLERIEAPRAGRHHPDQGDVVVRVGDGPQALLEVADLGRVEQRQPAHDGVRDLLLAQPGDDLVAVLVLAVQDRDGSTRPAGRRRPAASAADRVDDGDRLILGTGARHDLDQGALAAEPSTGACPAPGVRRCG